MEEKVFRQSGTCGAPNDRNKARQRIRRLRFRSADEPMTFGTTGLSLEIRKPPKLGDIRWGEPLGVVGVKPVIFLQG